MENVHPTMQQALAGIVPPGFRSAPVMHATQHLRAINADLNTRLSQYDAPPCPPGQFAYTFQHPELGALDCHVEHEPAAPECGWPEEVTLHAAYLRGVDITDRLTRDEVHAIEHAALRAPRAFQEPA